MDVSVVLCPFTKPREDDAILETAQGLKLEDQGSHPCSALNSWAPLADLFNLRSAFLSVNGG